MTWLPLRAPESLSGEEAELVSALHLAAPEASEVAEPTRRGATAIRTHDPTLRREWSEQVTGSGCRELSRYLAGLANDQTALMNALSLPHSNDPTEGHVNHVKLIKRSMYARASIELLRNKILYKAA